MAFLSGKGLSTLFTHWRKDSFNVNTEGHLIISPLSQNAFTTPRIGNIASFDQTVHSFTVHEMSPMLLSHIWKCDGTTGLPLSSQLAPTSAHGTFQNILKSSLCLNDGCASQTVALL